MSAVATGDRQISPYRYVLLNSVLELTHLRGTAQRVRARNNQEDELIARQISLVGPSLDSSDTSAPPCGGSVHSVKIAALAMGGVTILHPTPRLTRANSHQKPLLLGQFPMITIGIPRARVRGCKSSLTRIRCPLPTQNPIGQVGSIDL